MGAASRRRHVALAGSHRARPEGAKAVGKVAPDEPIVVWIYLRDPTTEAHAPGSAADLAALARPTTRRALARERAPGRGPGERREIGRAAGRVDVGGGILQVDPDDDGLVRCDLADSLRAFGMGAMAAGERDIPPPRSGAHATSRRSGPASAASPYRRPRRRESTRRNRPTYRCASGRACLRKWAGSRGSSNTRWD